MYRAQLQRTTYMNNQVDESGDLQENAGQEEGDEEADPEGDGDQRVTVPVEAKPKHSFMFLKTALHDLQTDPYLNELFPPSEGSNTIPGKWRKTVSLSAPTAVTLLGFIT